MAAKKIQVSSDNGANWYDLPGSGGSFSIEGEELDDTILGQSFTSNHPGIIGWEIASNAIWKGYAGYLAEIYQQGTSTPFTTEAMTLVSGKTYKITNATKNVWNRAVTTNVFDNAVNRNVEVLNIDWLYGRVTFKSTFTVIGPVTVTGAYFPMAQLGKGNSYTLTMTTDPIDNTDFSVAQANGGYKTFIPGLRTVSLELGGIFNSTVNSKDDVNDRLELMVQIDPIGDGLSTARGFFRILSAEQSGDVGALEEENLSLVLSVPANGAFTVESAFKWIHDAGTTIPTAIQKILEAYVAETTVDVRYLPTGATGATPLDGVTGDAVVTDVSVSGGISEMNVFEATFTGTGAYTEV